MKIVILTALFAAVAYGQLNSQPEEHQTQWPWQVGYIYRYEVQSYNLAHLPEGASSGNAFKATLVVRVKSPGQLQARLENPQNAQVHQEVPERRWSNLPEDLKFSAVKNLEMPFSISVEGGRVVALQVPSTLSLSNENLLKGLISTLQVDLSTYRTKHNSQNYYDQKTQQGQFKKMETDVTGECSILYTVTPAPKEWHRELNDASLVDSPIMITKSKNYGHCHQRVSYHFGVPEASEWTGTADRPEKEQFIDRAETSRILAGQNGDIYKAATTNTIYVHPYVYGQQKAEVVSQMKLKIISKQSDNDREWEEAKTTRHVQSLLYSMTTKQMPTRDMSEESNEERDVAVSAEHSSTMTKKTVSIHKKIVINKRKNYVEEDYSKSSDSNSAFVNDEDFNPNEPAYAALYMNPQTHKVYKQNPANALKLVQELTQILQNVNNMPKADFLSKFNILVRIIAAMDYEQLTQTSQSIETAQAVNEVVKADMWMIYRDAVAQAGTLPAFKQIVSWIQSKKIRGEEAAQVVSTLTYTLRYPTKKVMKEFFDLAMNPEVTKQQFLNSTVLIAATKLINMGQVNNKTAHSFYPTHMYGRLSHKHDNFVREDILPRLQQALEQAIKEKDSRNAQVYIKAIGNLGHRSILEVFAPYLRGEIPTSTYLRALMVEQLVILAQEKDSHTRAVLYNILRNPEEPYEVRVAAIHNIFVAHPTTEMMQAMAQMTHDDPSIQVRSVIKSAIESAAKQENPRHLDLARKAQAARPMLTKEEFGMQYSSKQYRDYFDNDYELGIIGVLSTIGSKDNMFPKHLKYSRRSQTNGWDSISASVSSVQRLVEIFKKYMSRKETSEKQSPNEYNARRISEMLNTKPDLQDPLEAALFVGLWNQQRYFTFDEHDLNNLPATVKKLLSELKGVKLHYTKVFNQAQISVMFPMASGMPFIYKYKEPTALRVQGKVNDLAKYDSAAQSAAFNGEIEFTYARNIDGSVGFLDTLSNKIASVGYVNKVQLSIPVKVDYSMKKGEHKMNLQKLRPEQDTTIAHYSVWPYSTIQKKDTLVPISLDPETKLTKRTNKVISLTDNPNAQYQLEGYSYSSDFTDMIKQLRSSNTLSNIIKAVYQKDVASTHFNLKYRGNKKPNPSATFTAVYDSFHNVNEPEESAEELRFESYQGNMSPNNPERRSRFIKLAAAGIKSAKAQVIELSAAYAEDSKILITAAIADSPVDPKIKYAFSAITPSIDSEDIDYELNSKGEFNMPERIALNAQQALEKARNMNFKIGITYDRYDRPLQQRKLISIQGQTEQTKQYTEELKELLWAKKCFEQMKRNNNYQDECHKLIIMAQAPDQMKINVSNGNVTPLMWSALYRVYRYFDAERDFFRLDRVYNENPSESAITIRNNYLDNIMNVFLGENIVLSSRIPPVAAHSLSTYQPIKPYERFANFYTKHLFQPFCTVDGHQIRTFSGRSFSYDLAPTWHVVTMDQPKKESWQDELVVLAQRQSEQQLEVYISYQSETGQDLEIKIQPSTGKYNVNVKTNSKKVSENDLVMYWDETEEKPLLEYYNLPEGVLMLHIRENRLRVMYDGQRLVVLTREGRNRVRGICGPMSGDARDDYKTPYGRVYSDDFGAYHVLVPNSSYIAPKLKSLNLPNSDERNTQYTTILKSDSQWQKWNSEDSSEKSDDWSSQKQFKTRSYVRQPRGNCVLAKQVQYHETSSQICVTTKPLAGCASHCKGEGYKVSLEPVVCSSKKDLKFQEYVDQIHRGKNPKVAGPSVMKQFRVPSTCRA